jgi:hypothetical protein
MKPFLGELWLEDRHARDQLPEAEDGMKRLTWREI